MQDGANTLDSSESEALRRRVTELEAALAATTSKLAAVTTERDKLRRVYEQLKEQYELLKRRIFVAKAERLDVQQLELEFAETKAKLEALSETLGLGKGDNEPKKKTKTPPKGRRDLRALDMEETRIEILDDELEGKAERIGFEESCRLARRRGGFVRVVVARATYKLPGSDGTKDLFTARRPKELFERCFLAPSMFAYVLHAKYGMGIPFYRLEEQCAREGIALDRGSMCRYAENAGATLGGIVDAMIADAMQNAFCLATDATGVAIQPTPLADKSRQPCRRGHFFVVLADRDHVFFEYQAKHNSDAVCAMFRGYSGYFQADAHAIYDALFRGDAVADGVDPPDEVGCWSHARRKFWEAAAAKYAIGREGLYRIRKLFELDAGWASLPPEKRREHRDTLLRPFVDEFFAWAAVEYERVKEQRGLVASAFGYALRQENALRRFLEDGRLRMDNNASERALRHIAIGRKNWLFFGSDDHASAAANLFSLIASCKLHRLDPEAYLADVIRVMPHWPRERYLELSPKHWAATRARLDPDALAREVGDLVVPPATAQESATR